MKFIHLEASILSETSRTVTYLLPSKSEDGKELAAAPLPSLFSDLESVVREDAKELGISSVGLSLTTLEEIFLLLSKD